MARLTRVERQEHTHERLLEAGRLVFLRRGYLAATVEEIASEGGYTRGAVYKHFGGKEGLWQAIVEARTRAHLDGLREALDGAGSHRELLAALNPRAGAVDDDAARWTVAGAEYLAAVARQPHHANALADLQRRLDEEVTALLARNCRRLDVQPAVPLPDVVVAWGSLGAGLALRWAIDTAIDPSGVAAGVLAVLFPEPDRRRTEG